MDDIHDRVKMDLDDTYKYLQRCLHELIQHAQYIIILKLNEN